MASSRKGAARLHRLPDLYGRFVRLGWAMADELEKQLERIETTVAEIVQLVRKLRDDRTAAGETAAGEINQRLRRFLERKTGVE